MRCATWYPRGVLSIRVFYKALGRASFETLSLKARHSFFSAPGWGRAWWRGKRRKVCVRVASGDIGSVADWVQIGFAMAAAVTAWVQWRKSCEVSRAEHLRDLLSAMKDSRIEKAYYRYIDGVDYGGRDGDFYLGALRFAEAGCPEENIEAAIDEMLLLFSSICHEHALGVIRDNEFEFFSYQIHRALAHREIKAYIKDLVDHAVRHNHGFPFAPFVDEGATIEEAHYSSLRNSLRTRRRRIWHLL